MGLSACYVAHNEAASIARSMLSVKAYVDRYVVVDVAFEANPGPLHSTDDQRALVELAAEGRELVYLEPEVPLREDHARNLYIGQVPLGAWLLQIDADEVMVGDHPALVALRAALDDPDVEVGGYQLRTYTTAVLAPLMAPQIGPALYATAPRIATSGYMARIVRRTEGMHYARQQLAPTVFSHHGLVDAYGPVGDELQRSDAAIIINDHAGQDYTSYQRDYQWEVAQGGSA